MHRDGPRPNRFSPASRGLLVEFHLGASQWVLLPHCAPFVNVVEDTFDELLGRGARQPG